jgi:hypothetical protein
MHRTLRQEKSRQAMMGQSSLVFGVDRLRPTCRAPPMMGLFESEAASHNESVR